jgi:hypothetical protein
MACACDLNGSLIIDMSTGGERRSKPQRRQGASALFSIEVLEMKATANLEIDIWHKNRKDTSSTQAGAFTSISSTGVHTLHISGIKEEYYWRYRVDASGDPDRYLVGSPTAQWFTY